jgi:hypothetical protein
MASRVLDPLKFGYAGGIIAAMSMLLMGIFGNFGIYTNAVDMMIGWHMFFSLSAGGILAGMIEAAIWTFLFLYAFVWIYNRI